MFQPYPLTFKPALIEKIWGGCKLSTMLGKDLESRENVGESWEITDRPEAQSIVENGFYAGKTLHELMQDYSLEIVGCEMDIFPLLIKFIDAKQRLSLQVHPHDDNATNLGGESKTEAWYILHADEGAEIIYGLKKDCSPEEFRSALKEDKLEDCLNSVQVKENEFYFIEGGVVHSTGAGILFAEVQQNSDTTYRLSDWGRKKPDGSPRDLHLNKALQALNLKKQNARAISVSGKKNTPQELIDIQAFRIEHGLVDGEQKSVDTDNRFHVIMGLKGTAQLHWNDSNETLTLSKGSVVLVPAALRNYSLDANDFEFLTVTARDAH